MKIFVVIPAHNEANRIGKVLNGINKTRFPVVVVDDGSTDNTYILSKKTKATAIRHKINLGKGEAMKTGAEAAFRLGADAVIFMDSDGQHSVDDLELFVKEINRGKSEIVFGQRVPIKEVPQVRFLGNKIISYLVKFLYGISVKDILCGYRAITKKAYYLIKWESSGYEVETEMAILTGKRKIKYSEVPVQMIYHDKLKGLTVISGMDIFVEIFRQLFI